MRAQVSNRPVLEQKASVNVWQQIGAEEPAAAAQQLMKQNDNFGYKARPQMLFQKRMKKHMAPAAKMAKVSLSPPTLNPKP